MAASEDAQTVSGPYSLSIRGGSTSDSGTIGVDARTDFINPVLNFHLFGTYDLMDASSGMGVVDSQRYGAGFALSHTYTGKANVFIGTSFVNEMDKYFGHAYLGGKFKASDEILLSASYGVGLGPDKQITKKRTRFLSAQSVDWGKLGAVYVRPDGIKTNIYYYITDPGGKNISGLEGEASYPVTDSLAIGINGSGDLSTKADVDRDWRGFLFLTYAFGSQKGTPIDVALDKNSPVAYPKVIRTVGSRAAAAAPASAPLSISPASTTNAGCSAPASVFTASGGKAPYTWSSNAPLALTVLNATQARWWDTGDNYCGGGPHTVTVTDSTGATATATIN
ncbi:MAG: hypothetical protein HY889_06005 [Deltaproteobacteria bacterium]|nr:hypothetical protein [Deltaproteobacteria bacterium]